MANESDFSSRLLAALGLASDFGGALARPDSRGRRIAEVGSQSVNNMLFQRAYQNAFAAALQDMGPFAQQGAGAVEGPQPGPGVQAGAQAAQAAPASQLGTLTPQPGQPAQQPSAGATGPAATPPGFSPGGIDLGAQNLEDIKRARARITGIDKLLLTGQTQGVLPVGMTFDQLETEKRDLLLEIEDLIQGKRKGADAGVLVPGAGGFRAPAGSGVNRTLADGLAGGLTGEVPLPGGPRTGFTQVRPGMGPIPFGQPPLGEPFPVPGGGVVFGNPFAQ